MIRKLWSDVQRMRAGFERVYGINRRNVELVYAHNPRRLYPFADDKILAKQCMEKAGVPTSKTLAVCRGLFEVNATLEKLQALDNFVIKPCMGSGGDGILITGARKDDGWLTPKGWISDATVHQHMANIVFGAFSNQLEDTVLVETRVRPHELFREFWPEGVCDIRIICLEDTPFISMIRIPTSASGGKANLHQGGIGAAVDLATGITTRAVSRGKPCEIHPESGVRIVGREIPMWKDCVDVARRASAAVPLNYVGVDIVIDDVEGPLILEINARPGLEIQNINGFGLGHALEKSA
ncbi:MAG: sugar-transfer associated ATP-grasp domain-containing protein [bacterium]